MRCPRCGAKCERDMVDIGVGEMAAGPFGCPDCYWVEGDPASPQSAEPTPRELVDAMSAQAQSVMILIGEFAVRCTAVDARPTTTATGLMALEVTLRSTGAPRRCAIRREATSDDAPSWMGMDPATAWADGWNAARREVIGED